MSRKLTDGELEIVRMCGEKYGVNQRDEVFFLETGEALFQIWGENGTGPIAHLTNLASLLAEGVLTPEEIRNTQI